MEVIDPRTLWPLDEALILQSVRKTSRLVIAHEAPRRGGWGAELLSLVQESQSVSQSVSQSLPHS